MSSRRLVFLRLCPPLPFRLCVPYNLEFPPVNTLPPSFSLLIYFHVVAFGQPTVSKMVNSMAFFSSFPPLPLVEYEPGREILRWAGPDWAKQGQKGGILEDMWMWPPCLQERWITSGLTNCRVSRPLNGYDSVFLSTCTLKRIVLVPGLRADGVAVAAVEHVQGLMCGMGIWTKRGRKNEPITGLEIEIVHHLAIFNTSFITWVCWRLFQLS